MIYRVIGISVCESLEGFDVVFAELSETGGNWAFSIIESDEIVFERIWMDQLKNVAHLSILDFQVLHASFGEYIGELVNDFIRERGLEHKVHLIASFGYPVFDFPGSGVSVQLGHGAYISAKTHLPVVSDLGAMDIAFGGKGAPLTPIAKKLFSEFELNSSGQKALTIALMGVLRWREEANMLATATKASQNSIGGALWLGTGV